MMNERDWVLVEHSLLCLFTFGEGSLREAATRDNLVLATEASLSCKIGYVSSMICVGILHHFGCL